MARISIITLITAFLGIAAFALWFPFDVMMLGGYALLAFAGTGVGVGFYVLSGSAKKDQQQALIKREVEREQALYAEVEALSGQLTDMALPDSARQAERLMGMLEDYRRVIEQKLGDTTITMSSYSAETGRVFRLSINNLKDILAAAQSVHTTKLETPDDDLLESEALQRRRALLTQQEARIDSLVEQNRDLLTALNETTVQVANIKDINSFELQESLDRLRELGERAQAFSKQ